MTDAEPAPSCAPQIQVKVRRCNQVIVLTSFCLTFYGLRLLLAVAVMIPNLLTCSQYYDGSGDTGLSTAGFFFWTSLASQMLISYRTINVPATML